MTTATVSPARAELGRIGRIVRLNFANPMTSFIVPLIVVASIFAINLAIWIIVARATDGSEEAVAGASQGLQWSGAGLWIFVYMTVIAAQTMNLTFPYALGLGTTRRDFYLGSVATFLLMTVGYTALFLVLGAVEEATGGWGLGGSMFRPVYFGPGFVDQLVAVLSLFLFFFFVGAAFGTVFLRGKATALTLALVGTGLVVLLAAMAITFAEAWGAVGEFFGALGFAGSWALLLVPTAVAAVVGFLLIRRATPRG